MFETLREAFETYLESLPPNIRAVRELWISKLHDCACAGIPVWHVPRTEVIDALMDASSTDRRYRVLDHYRAEIIEDCREQIELLEPNDRPVLIEMKATFGAEG